MSARVTPAADWPGPMPNIGADTQSSDCYLLRNRLAHFLSCYCLFARSAQVAGAEATVQYYGYRGFHVGSLFL